MCHRPRSISLLLLLALLVAACSPLRGSDDRTDGAGTVPVDTGQQAGMQLISTLDSDADAAAVGQAVNAFGFDLLAQLGAGDETTITSPLSVATMLGMVLAGAGGDTAAAMAEVLHLEDPADIRMGALLDLLTATDQVTLDVANGLWADPDTTFEDAYVDTVTEVLDARVTQADLGEAASAAEIDAWVREQTAGRIDGIAADLGLPDPEIVLVLLNAVYFLGEWTTAFDPAESGPRPFTLADGAAVDVATMTMREASFDVARGEGFRMARLPYGEDGRFAMEVMLPDGDLTTLVEGLDADVWAAAVSQLAPQQLDRLSLPSFELSWGRSIRQDLAAMGMGSAFDASVADFTPMSPTSTVLDEVVHKTFIRVDEAGTEAAAVTGGGMRATSVQETNDFLVDRPFAFTISDDETGTILFLGTVTDPRG